MCYMAHRLLATGWHSARQVASSNHLAAVHPLRMEIACFLPFPDFITFLRHQIAQNENQ